jgi:hypothetical protein
MKIQLVFFTFIFFVAQSIAQGNLQFNQVLLIDNNTATVPVGKIWKIENIVYEAVPYFQANSGSGTCAPCNGSSQLWTSYTTQTCQVLATTPMTINGVKASAGNTGSPLWLPAGSTLSGETKTCTPNAGSYGASCICPPPSVTAKTYISVIEFNIIP